MNQIQKLYGGEKWNYGTINILSQLRYIWGSWCGWMDKDNKARFWKKERDIVYQWEGVYMWMRVQKNKEDTRVCACWKTNRTGKRDTSKRKPFFWIKEDVSIHFSVRSFTVFICILLHRWFSCSEIQSILCDSSYLLTFHNLYRCHFVLRVSVYQNNYKRQLCSLGGNMNSETFRMGETISSNMRRLYERIL